MFLPRKHTQNVIIDFISFVCMALLMVSGFLLHYKLPHGSHNATLIGYSRPQWGEFHFWVAIVFVSGILVHLLLHIPWIKSSMSPQHGEKQRYTLLVVSFAVYALLVISLGLFLSPVMK